MSQGITLELGTNDLLKESEQLDLLPLNTPQRKNIMFQPATQNEKF